MKLAQRALRHVLIDIGPLRRHRDFRLLFLGQMATSFLGSMLTYVAIPYQVYRADGLVAHGRAARARRAGAVLALGLVGGALADVIDRRRLVLLTELALMAMSGVLLRGTRTLDASLRLWLIFAVAAVTAGARGRCSARRSTRCCRASSSATS